MILQQLPQLWLESIVQNFPRDTLGYKITPIEMPGPKFRPMAFRRPRHSQFLRSRAQLYGCYKSCVIFLLLNQATVKLIVLSGYTEVNPGPVKNSCSICGKAVARTHRSLKCSSAATYATLEKTVGMCQIESIFASKVKGVDLCGAARHA